MNSKIFFFNHVALCIVTFVVFNASSSFATQIDTHHFGISSPGQSSFSFVNTNELIPNHRLGAKILFGFANEVVSLTNNTGSKLLDLVGERYYSDLSAAYGIYNWNIGFRLPAVFYQVEPDRPVAGLDAYSESGTGDLFVFLRYRLLGRPSRGWGLGFSVDSVFPTATADFMGDGKFGGGGSLIADYRSKFFSFAHQLSFIYSATQDFLNLRSGKDLTAGLAVAWHFYQRPKLSLNVESLIKFADFQFEKVQMPNEIVGSLHWRAMKEISVATGYGRSFGEGFGGIANRGFLSLSYHPQKQTYLEKAWKAPGIEIYQDQIVVDRELSFYPESDELTGNSEFSLDALSETLRQNAWIKKIEVRVITGGGPSASTYLHLASRRAKKLVSELVRRGVVPSRLSSQAVLSYKKSASDKSDEQKVEFIILSSLEGEAE